MAAPAARSRCSPRRDVPSQRRWRPLYSRLSRLLEPARTPLANLDARPPRLANRFRESPKSSRPLTPGQPEPWRPPVSPTSPLYGGQVRTSSCFFSTRLSLQSAPPPSTNHRSHFALAPPPPRNSTRKFQWTLHARSGIDISVSQWRSGSRARGGARAAAAGRAGLVAMRLASRSQGARRGAGRAPTHPSSPRPSWRHVARERRPWGARGGWGGSGAALAARFPVFVIPDSCVSSPSQPPAGGIIYPYLVARRQKFNLPLPTSFPLLLPAAPAPPLPVLSGRNGSRASSFRRRDPRRGLRCRQPEENSAALAASRPPSMAEGKSRSEPEAEAVFSLILAKTWQADSPPCAHPLSGAARAVAPLARPPWTAGACCQCCCRYWGGRWPALVPEVRVWRLVFPSSS